MTLRFVLFGATLLTIAHPRPALAQPIPVATFDKVAWKADYERLKQALAQGYANLDWQVDRRGLNLVGADKAISAMLDKAGSDVEAALIFARLVEAFKDPHLQLIYGPAPASAALLPQQSDTGAPVQAAELCKAAGFGTSKPATRLPYAGAPGWTPISDAPFQAGLIGKTGFLRIPAFGEDRFADACAKVARPGLEGRELQLAVRAELNRQLASLIATLKARGMTRLAVDISGNGGGSEWSAEVAAMLTGGELTRQAPRRAAPSCDRQAMWRGERPCDIYGASAQAETFAGKGVWTGPLAVLVDRRSASAAEEFVTLLKGSKRAVILGERTFGSGCGYIDGGHAFAFKAAPMHIMMPNCSRYTAEGVNEIEGIAPMLPVDWATLPPADVPALLDKAFAVRL